MRNFPKNFRIFSLFLLKNIKVQDISVEFV
jgi:hypothetical protein